MTPEGTADDPEPDAAPMPHAAPPLPAPARDDLPFHADATPFATTGFEEATARLLFLAERAWPAGWVRGPEGCGKTAVLKTAGRELRRVGGNVAYLASGGLDAESFWPAVAAAFGAAGRVGDVRTRIRDAAAAAAHVGRPLTLLLDDADRLVESGFLGTLLRAVEGLAPSPTVIVATTAATLPADVASRIDLRIDLRPFDRGETAEYVAFRLSRAGLASDLFDAAAITELAAQSGGVPAAVNRLADLALVAVQAGAATRVDAATIRSAAADLFAAADPLAEFPAVARRAVRTA